MANRNRDRLAKLNQALAPDAEAAAEEQGGGSRVGVLLQRDSALNKIATGKQKAVKQLMHSPARIRMWEEHNRDYSLLSPQRCADLIDGFKRAGRQEFPAIVRKLEDPNYDYELICGARRHWTATHVGWDLLIEVRDLTDRQAFTLQDLENRDREDISDYERAIDYKHALPKYFEGNRAQMAKYLEIDKSNFHRLLDLAELPKTIVDAYGDLRELKAHHGAAYKKLMLDSGSKRRIMDKARSLKAQGVAGPKVVSLLKAAASGPKEPTKPRTFGRIEVRPSGSAYSLNIKSNGPQDADGLEGLRQDFEKFLSALEKGRL